MGTKKELTRVLPVRVELLGVDGPSEYTVVDSNANRKVLFDTVCAGVELEERVDVGGFVIAAVGVRPAGSGRSRNIDTVVVEDAGDVEGVLVGAGTRGLGDRAQPVVVGRLISLDNDIVSLANTNVDGLSGEGLDRDQISSDDSQGVVVDAEAEVRVEGRVDEAETGAGSGGNGSLELGTASISEGIGSVDKSVLRGRRSGGLGLLEEGVGSLVVPVRKQQSALVVIIGSGGRAVDDNTSKDTVPTSR